MTKSEKEDKSKKSLTKSPVEIRTCITKKSAYPTKSYFHKKSLAKEILRFSTFFQSGVLRYRYAGIDFLLNLIHFVRISQTFHMCVLKGYSFCGQTVCQVDSVVVLCDMSVKFKQNFPEMLKYSHQVCNSVKKWM